MKEGWLILIFKYWRKIAVICLSLLTFGSSVVAFAQSETTSNESVINVAPSYYRLGNAGQGNLVSFNQGKLYKTTQARAYVNQVFPGEFNEMLNPEIGYGSREDVNLEYVTIAPIFPAWISQEAGVTPNNFVYLSKEANETIYKPLMGANGLLGSFLQTFPEATIEYLVNLDYAGSEDTMPSRVVVGFRGVNPDGTFLYINGPALDSPLIETYEQTGEGWTYVSFSNQESYQQVLAPATGDLYQEGGSRYRGFLGEPTPISKLFSREMDSKRWKKADITKDETIQPGVLKQAPSRWVGILPGIVLMCVILLIGVTLAVRAWRFE